MSQCHIPQSFELLGRRFRVVLDVVDDAENFGEYDSHNDTITIYIPPDTDIAGHTFCHELIHAILSTLGYAELNDDEKFVDLVGGLLWQFLRSARGECQ